MSGSGNCSRAIISTSLSVSVCSKLARKLFMLGSWAFVAASHAKRRSGNTGAWSLCPVAQAAADAD